MTPEISAIVSEMASLAATVSKPEIADGVSYLMALSEALWEKASQEAGPEITDLFSAHIEIEELIRWLQNCQQSSWLSPEIAQEGVQQAINKALAIFGEDPDKALEPYI